MSFLAPLFLLGGLAAAIPIIVHLLKHEPDARVSFSAVKLLQSAPIEHASRRHLRELLLLALRIAALLLLASAFARPFFASSDLIGTGVTVVALDTSLSMSAPGQFEKARELARDAVRRGRAGLVGLVTFGDVATVVAPLTADRAMVESAIAGVSPGAGSTSYRAALNAAADLLRNRQGAIVVVTDLQANGWDAGDRVSIPANATIQIADVGAPPANLAVTAVRLAEGKLLATVHNSGPQARDARVSVAVSAGGPGTTTVKAGETTVPVAAAQSADVAFPAPAGRWAAVSVVDGTGAAGDDTRYLVLNRGSRPRLLFVTPTGDVSREAFYLQQAVVAAGVDGSAYDVEGVSGAALEEWSQARLDGFAAVVVVSTRAVDHRARALLAEYTRKGGGMLVPASESVDGEIITEALGGEKIAIVPPARGAADVRSLAPADARHPIFRAFVGRSSLGLVRFRSAAVVRAPGCQTLARFTTGEAALLDCEVGQGHALVTAFDLDNRGNDFPLHATFVPFVHETIGYLSAAARSSDYLMADAPATVPRAPGVAQLGGSEGGPSRLISVNVNPAESDAGRLTAEEFNTAVTRLQDQDVSGVGVEAREQEERQHLWQYVLAFVIAVLMLESFVATRTA